MEQYNAYLMCLTIGDFYFKLLRRCVFSCYLIHRFQFIIKLFKEDQGFILLAFTQLNSAFIYIIIINLINRLC